MLTVTSGDEPATEDTVGGGHPRLVGLDVVNPGHRGLEADLTTAVEELADQVGDEFLLRVDSVCFTASEPAVLQFEFGPVAAERADVVVQPAGT